VRYRNQPFRARLGFALQGIAHAIATQASLRSQLWVALAVLVLLCVLRPEPVWWALVGLATALVLAAELFNTAVEELADVVHPDENAGIRVVKDCAAAAVLMSVLGALAVGAALLLHLLGVHALITF
jgi:undecaprenol kinase